MEIIRLKDLCTVDITDGTHQTPTYCKAGFIFLSSKNVTSQTIDWNDVKYIPKELHDELHKRVAPQKNDILLAKNGTTGIAAMVEEDLIFDIYVSLALIRPNTKIVLPRYLLYAINNPITKRYFDSHLKGIGVPNLHLTHIKETPIVLYEIPIQQKIVRLLDKVSDLITKRRAQLDKLDLLVKARFVEMFGDPVLNPHGYVVQSLQSLIDDGVITYHLDGNHGGDYPRNEEFVDSGVPYIGANCISKGKVNFRYAKYLTSERAGKLRKGIAQNGDVLFAHNATVGPVAVLETEEPKVILSTSLTAYRCNPNVILPNYLKIYMQSEGFIRQYSEEMKQSTRNQVPITAQKKYLFLLPPMVLQTQFNAFVVQTDKSKSAIQRSLDKLEILKKALMQQYFG